MTFQEFMDLVGEHFPDSFVDVDNDGQLIVYTNFALLTDADNPTIPAGECVLVPFDGE